MVRRTHLYGNISQHDEREKTIVTYLNEFSQRTALHGFPFAADSFCWLEKTMWILLTLLFIAVTIRDVINATEAYVAEPKSTLITLVDEHILHYPHVTVCIPIIQQAYRSPSPRLPLSAFRDDHFHGSTVDIFDNREIAKLLRRIERNGTKHLLQRFNGSSETATVLESGDTDIIDLFLLTVRMIGQITSVEQMHAGSCVRIVDNETETSSIESTFAWDLDGHREHPARTALKQTFQFYMRARVKLDELLQTISYQLCKLFHLQVELTQYFAATTVERVTCRHNRFRLIWFSILPFLSSPDRNNTLYICYDIGNVTLTPSNTVTLSLNPAALYKPERNLTEAERNALTTFVDLTGSRTKTKVSSSIYDMYLFNFTKIYVEMFGQFKATSTSKHKCSDDISYFDCRSTCRAHYTLEHCGCWPLSMVTLPTMPSNAPICPAVVVASNDSFAYEHVLRSSDENCYKIVDHHDPDPDCADVCPEHCDRTILLNVNKYSMDHNKPGETAMLLKAKRFIFPVFEEQLAIDLNTFLSNVGGILGLWIGASFLAIIHVFTFIIRVAITTCKNHCTARSHHRSMTSLLDVKLSRSSRHQVNGNGFMHHIPNGTISTSPALINQSNGHVSLTWDHVDGFQAGPNIFPGSAENVTEESVELCDAPQPATRQPLSYCAKHRNAVLRSANQFAVILELQQTVQELLKENAELQSKLDDVMAKF